MSAPPPIGGQARTIVITVDPQFAQALDYPTVNVDVDRERAGQPHLREPLPRFGTCAELAQKKERPMILRLLPILPHPLFRLSDVSRLRLSVSVPEADLDGLEVGRAVSFTVPPYPYRSFSGKVARIPHELDPKTRSEAVELDVRNADGALTPGMYAETQWIAHRSRPTFFVPVTAVVTTTERIFVVRARSGVLRRLPTGSGNHAFF